VQLCGENTEIHDIPMEKKETFSKKKGMPPMNFYDEDFLNGTPFNLIPLLVKEISANHGVC